MPEIATVEPNKKGLINAFAERYGVDANKVMDTLKSTAFRQSGNNTISNEQMMALMIVANEYKLNPFTKEIFAFPDKGSIVPVVSVDGWSRIMNENPAMDGIEFEYSPETVDHKGKTAHVWIDCLIYRKDRTHPTRVREFFNEVKKETNPWLSHPNRMHRHKAEIQCARIAFGFAGIYDQDEAERIIESSNVVDITPTAPELQSYNDEQKAYFDQLITEGNALEMYVFQQQTDGGVFANLYNSFEKGTTVKYKRIVDGLTSDGAAQFRDCVEAVAQARVDGDESAEEEIKVDCSEAAWEMICAKAES